MTDNLRDRIAAVQLAHMPDDYQRDNGECPCGFKYTIFPELAAHVADAVIHEFGRIYEDGLEGTVFSAIRLVEQPKPRHFTDESAADLIDPPIGGNDA
jgi:hypothetical protein